jgi:hypothetical protein
MDVSFTCAAEQRFRGDEEKVVRDLTLAFTPKAPHICPSGQVLGLSTSPAINLGKENLSFCRPDRDDFGREILDFRRAGFAA